VDKLAEKSDKKKKEQLDWLLKRKKINLKGNAVLMKQNFLFREYEECIYRTVYGSSE